MNLSSDILHQLGPDKPVSVSSVVSSKVFQVVFIHLVHNPALLLASCWCSFLLHVAANLICVFLVSRPLILLSTFPKFLLTFLWSQRVHPAVLKNFILILASHFLSFFFLRVQISPPYKRMATAIALNTLIVENFWTKISLKVLFRIPSIWANFTSFWEVTF